MDESNNFSLLCSRHPVLHFCLKRARTGLQELGVRYFKNYVPTPQDIKDEDGVVVMDDFDFDDYDFQPRRYSSASILSAKSIFSN